MKLGAAAARDGVEARALFLAWEEMEPLSVYALEDPEWHAVVAMRDQLPDLYSDTCATIHLGVQVQEIVGRVGGLVARCALVPRNSRRMSPRLWPI